MNTQAPDARLWSVSQANAWCEDLPWLCGCNFVPSTAVNSNEMWQAASFDPTDIDH